MGGGVRIGVAGTGEGQGLCGWGEQAQEGKWVGVTGWTSHASCMHQAGRALCAVAVCPQWSCNALLFEDATRPRGGVQAGRARQHALPAARSPPSCAGVPPTRGWPSLGGPSRDLGGPAVPAIGARHALGRGRAHRQRLHASRAGDALAHAWVVRTRGASVSAEGQWHRRRHGVRRGQRREMRAACASQMHRASRLPRRALAVCRASIASAWRARAWLACEAGQEGPQARSQHWGVRGGGGARDGGGRRRRMAAPTCEPLTLAWGVGVRPLGVGPPWHQRVQLSARSAAQLVPRPARGVPYAGWVQGRRAPKGHLALGAQVDLGVGGVQQLVACGEGRGGEGRGGIWRGPGGFRGGSSSGGSSSSGSSGGSSSQCCTLRRRTRRDGLAGVVLLGGVAGAVGVGWARCAGFGWVGHVLVRAGRAAVGGGGGI